MTLNDIAVIVRDNGGMIAICAAIVMSLVEVSPIKINPWSWIGNVLNKDIIAKLDEHGKGMDELRKDVTSVKKEIRENTAISSRYRILRFDDEILHDTKHTKEHFDQILFDIDVYEEFCEEHPDFKNNLAVMAISHIKQVYQKCSTDNSFL